MGKSSKPRQLKDNQVRATARFVRVPPRKARLVLDAVRGKYVSDALATLRFVPNFAARAIEKVVRSAVANAENGRPYDDQGRALPPLNTDNLKLVRGQVDEGPRIKRIQPRAQGRAYRILKRMCHISVVLEETAPKPPKPRRVTAARRARAAGRVATATQAPAEVAPAATVEQAPAAVVTEATDEAVGTETVTAAEQPAANSTEATEPAEGETEQVG